MTHWKWLWCWERLRRGGEGDDRGWDGWMASQTQWTWVWVNSGSWWWTGRPGVLQSMGRKELDRTERLNWIWRDWVHLKKVWRLGRTWIHEREMGESPRMQRHQWWLMPVGKTGSQGPFKTIAYSDCSCKYSWLVNDYSNLLEHIQRGLNVKWKSSHWISWEPYSGVWDDENGLCMWLSFTLQTYGSLLS